MSVNYTSPVGRIVQGDPSEARTTDYHGQPLVYKTGPKTGQPREEYYTGLAIKKDNPDLPGFIALLQQAASEAFAPQYLSNPEFSWKYFDADTEVDKTGQPYSSREGHAGCMVFRFANGFPPTFYKRNEQTGGCEEIPGSEVKPGYYVQVAGHISGNNNASNPGIYLNFNMVLLAGYGSVISRGPSVDQAFGSAPAALPEGASTTPPAMTAAPAPAPAPAPTASAIAAPAPTVVAPVAPVPAPAPVAPVAPAPAPAPAAPAPAPNTAPVAQAPIAQAPVTAAPAAPAAVPGQQPVTSAPAFQPPAGAPAPNTDFLKP